MEKRTSSEQFDSKQLLCVVLWNRYDLDIIHAIMPDQTDLNDGNEADPEADAGTRPG